MGFSDRKDRRAAIAAYGGKCACCDEDYPEFLDIDHPNGDGAAHRRHLKGISIVMWLRQHGYPPGFRILCSNCNQSIARHGYCPHQLYLIRLAEARQLRGLIKLEPKSAKNTK